MAKSRNNVVTHGLSGKIGDLLVFRQRNGQTVVSKVPEQPKTVSEKQKAQRKRFQQAVLYAKSAVASPETGDLYRAKAKRTKTLPVNVAVADFFNAPDIEHIDLSGYTGEAGEEIRISVSDDFAVESVHVSIFNADGSTVEEGEAKNTGFMWVYTTVETNDSLEGDRIEVTASDLPGNETVTNREL